MTVYAGRIESIFGSTPSVTRIFDPYTQTEGLVIGNIGSYGGVVSNCVVQKILTLTVENPAYGMVISACNGSIDISASYSVIDGCNGRSLRLTGDSNDVVGFMSIDCSFDASYGISLIGNSNTVRSSSVRRSTVGPTGSSGVSCLNIVGNDNRVSNTELDGSTSGEYNVVVSGSSSGNKLLDLGVTNSASLSRYSVTEGTCIPSETKEWGKGGLVEASTSVVLRAWRDALIIHAYFNLGTAGSTDTDVDLLLNGSIIGSATVAAYATEGSVQLSTEINPGDLLSVEVTTAGTDAVDLSAQIGLI